MTEEGNVFLVSISVILFGLTLLCLLLPYRSGKRTTGIVVSLLLSSVILWTLIGELDFLVLFIWPVVFSIQVVFIVYWTFRFYNKPKLALVSTCALSLIFVLIALSPWISDWIFSKRDVRNILARHNIFLHDDFDIIKNESGGFRDYYETFTIKISESDCSNIASEFRAAIDKSKSEKKARRMRALGIFNGKMPDSDTLKETGYDTLYYETEGDLVREYTTKEKMEYGTDHFIFQLSVDKKELEYVGTDE